MIFTRFLFSHSPHSDIATADDSQWYENEIYFVNIILMIVNEMIKKLPFFIFNIIIIGEFSMSREFERE